MKALMLAAGVGRRLFGDDNKHVSKALLEFGGKSLLRRHIENLTSIGIEELVIIVGHRKDAVIAEAQAVAPQGFVSTIFNPRFEEAPMISLWAAREVLRAGNDILLMDADVLYHPGLLQKLVQSAHPNCFIMDRDFEPGDEPVKLCIRDGVLVDFGKQITEPYDTVGEWPGFMRMSPLIARAVAERSDHYMAAQPVTLAYEPAILDVLKSEPPGTFQVEDVTGIPWLEIDFPDDLRRAERITMGEIQRYDGQERPHVMPRSQ